MRCAYSPQVMPACISLWDSPTAGSVCLQHFPITTSSRIESLCALVTRRLMKAGRTGGSQCSEPWPDLVVTQPSNMMMISCPISHPAKIYNKWWGLIIKMALCITWRVIIVCIHMMILNPCVFPHIGMQCWDWVLFGFSTPNCWGQESLAFFWRSL